MKVLFKGKHTTSEAMDTVSNILKLFHESYGVSNIANMRLDLTLRDETGQEIELVDADTSEVLSTFEVFKHTPKGMMVHELPKQFGHLWLVVDNT